MVGIPEGKKKGPTSAGFEPTPSKRNRFLICRRNHLAMTPQGSKYNHATISPSLKDQITNLGTMGSPGYITPRYYIRVMSGPKSSQRLREHKSRREIIISCVSVLKVMRDRERVEVD